MNRVELQEILESGENSGVEFKRRFTFGREQDRYELAKEIVALANFEGGRILIGVADDGTPQGVDNPKQLEEWVMQVCRDKVKPEIIPFYEILQLETGEVIAIVQIIPERGIVRHVWHNNHKYWFIRVGSTSREASFEELQRLGQQRGLLRFDVNPVPGSQLSDLDFRRLRNYFVDIRGQEVPADTDQDAWERLLVNTEIMVESQGRFLPTIGGCLLFGKIPNRYLPQAGISAAVYPGQEKDYVTKERATIRGPIVPLRDAEGQVLENGLIEQAIAFVKRNTAAESEIAETGQRIDRWKDYPLEAVREAIVNALTHRDYTISGADIELSIYQDRLEVISPGRLPNTVTVDRMKAGCRVTRNELIKEVMRDYGYLEHMGMGIPRKIIRGMWEHNQTEPDLIPGEADFTLRLWKDKPQE